MKKNNLGFTLIESVIAIAVFAVLSSIIYFTYFNIVNLSTQLRLRSLAIYLINNQIEIIRNIPYENVGIQGGFPVGKLLAEQTLTTANINFLLKTTIRNIDDPFDGTLGGTPNDTAPADYKLVELEISSPSFSSFAPLKFTTSVAPKNLETATNNGALFINVFDAFAQPIKNANVSVVNNKVSPTIRINDVTNNSGVLQLVDIPTSTNGYAVKISKSGYSSDQTYLLGDPDNPNPVKPDATVASQQVTDISFAIDKISTINLKTSDKTCQPIPDINFLQNGTKLIGHNPDVLKYSTSSATDANGEKNISNLEWDTYNFSNLNNNYDLAGYNPLLPIILNPDSTIALSWLMEPKNPTALLLTIQDANGQLINDALVRLTKTGFDQTLYSGQRSFSRTDELIGTSSISTTFDFGSPDIAFYNLSWEPQDPSLSFQIATNNDNTIWNFLGPDGTPSTFYTTSNTPIFSGQSNNRYLRYRVDNSTSTSEEIKIDFHSSCSPDGQAFFNGLTKDTYNLTVQKTGYQDFSTNLSVTQNWQESKITLSQ